jgi:hypothetical protein
MVPILTITSSILVCVGFVHQIYTSFKTKATVGLSRLFFSLDLVGAVTGATSFAFRDNAFDFYGASMFFIVCLGQSILLVLGIWVYPNTLNNSNELASDTEISACIV